MGDTLGKIVGGVGQAVFPSVPIPERPVLDASGRPVLDESGKPKMVSVAPEGTTSFVDRALPLLGALGGVASGGNPLAGYIQGRAMQQQIARPYQQQYAAQQMAAQAREQGLKNIDNAIAAAQKQGNAKLVGQLQTLRVGIEGGLQPTTQNALIRETGQQRPSAVLSRARFAARQAGEDPSDQAVLDKYAEQVHAEDEAAKDRRAAQQRAFINTQFEVDRAAAQQRIAAKGGNPNDHAAVDAEIQTIQAEKAAAIDRAKFSAKADAATNISVADYQKKHGVELWNTETERPVQALTPVNKQVATGKVIALGKDDIKDLRAYREIRQNLDNVMADLPELKTYLDHHPDIKAMTESDGWMATKAGQKLIESDDRIAPFMAKLNLLQAMKTKQVYGARQSDYEQKRLRGYYGLPGLGFAKLESQLKGAHATIDDYIKSILTLTPEDREMMGAPSPSATPKAETHGYTPDEEEAAFGGGQ